MEDVIYLDAAATTKPDKEVIEAMMPYFTDKWYNPSSLYSPSVQVKKDIEEARKVIADFINAEPDEIYFTSSGSEANCWAIQGFINNYSHPSIITSYIEHKSILNFLDCCSNNIYTDCLNVDCKGNVLIDELKESLEIDIGCCTNNSLVSIQFANNEIGTIQNIKELCEITHKYNGLFHTDAVQVFGHLPIDVKDLGVDMLSVSGHKIGCPKGIGFLYIKNGVEIKPLIYGSQERGMRGGTENVPYIIGFAKAVELILNKNIASYRGTGKYIVQRTAYVRNYLAKLLEQCGCKINGSRESRLPNNINVTLPNKVTGESLIYMMDMSGICISAGSACNSHSQSVSHVLKAIGLSEEEAMRTIRITIPDDSLDINDIKKFVSELQKALKLLEI